MTNSSAYPTLVLASGRWMDRRTQEKLRRYILEGGQLILVGEIPGLDEDFQPARYPGRDAGASPGDTLIRVFRVDCRRLGKAGGPQARDCFSKPRSQPVLDLALYPSRKGYRLPVCLQWKGHQQADRVPIRYPWTNSYAWFDPSPIFGRCYSNSGRLDHGYSGKREKRRDG